MFKVALRMAWSDIRTVFQGWGMWVVLALLAFLVGVLPMVGGAEGGAWYCCAYGVGAAILCLSPRFTRAFHVVPFTIKQIKKLAIYRCIIFVGGVMLMGGLFLALAFIFSWDWDSRFGMWYFFYAELYFTIMKDRLIGFLPKKYKINIWLGIWISIIFGASVLMMIGLAEDLPLYVQYLIHAGLLLLYLPYPIIMFKNMDFHDYCQVRESPYARPSFLE